MMQAIQTTYDEPREDEPQTTETDAATTPEATPAKQEEEGTPTAAIAPLEEEVIDGEVAAILEPEQKPAPKQPPYYLIIVVTIAGCLLFTLVSYLLPLLTPSATVTIIPVERTIATTTAIQLQSRQLPPLTLSQSITVLATGKRHQDATQAQGTITFYNGLLSSQTIAAGTTLTGQDGVAIITDQPATIPAANPPTEGHVTVSAHALNTGTGGNIPAYDINQACCATSVLAKNTAAFTGGDEARDYVVITKSDLANAAATIQATLARSEQAALHAQLIEGEALITPSCRQATTADHRVGEEAEEATLTVSETCTGIAYDAHTLHLLAMQMITNQPTLSGYTVFGDVTESVVHASITDPRRGIATLTVKLDATYTYQITPGETQQLVHLIAGKSKSSALHKLLSAPGIAGASIAVKGNAATLPDNPKAITIVFVERVIALYANSQIVKPPAFNAGA